MTGFEPRTSGIAGNRSANWATTIAQVCILCPYTNWEDGVFDSNLYFLLIIYSILQRL